MHRLGVRLGLLTALLSLACGAPGTTASGPPAAGIPVKVQTLATVPVSDEVHAVGTIAAKDSVELRVETDGVVAFVGFTDGQPVKKGDVLLRLRPDAAQARVDDAAARVKLAEADYTRAEALFAKGSTSKAALQQAEADRDLARAARDLAKDGLRKTELRAPFDGVLTTRDVSVGAMVGPGVTVTRLDDVSERYVQIAVSERNLMAVEVGDPAEVRLDALPERVFTAPVSYVSPHVDEESRTAEVRVALPIDEALRPGLTATVVVRSTEPVDTLVVPTQAVVATATGPMVWIAGPDDKAAKVPVITGARTADTLEITSGLQAGQRVIVEGIVRLQPGAAITVKP